MKKTVLRERIETVLVVTLLTALVWLYAEGESVRTYREQVRIKFVAPPGQNLMIKPDTRTDAQGAIAVQVTFRASAGQHQAFREHTSHNIIQIPVPGPGTDQAIVLKDALVNQTSIGELGLNIQQTEPQTETLTVEPLTSVTLPVQVDPGNLHLTQPPTASPAQVQVQLPTDMAARAKNAYLIASLADLDLSGLQVNVPHTRQVPLRLPYLLRGTDAQLQQSTVQVTFTIENLTATLTLANIPIHINATPLLLSHYQIALSTDNMVLRDVTLSGPADEIDKIRRKQIKIWAEIRPTMDEMSQGATTAKLFIHKPADVQVVSPIPRVPIKVTPQQ